VSQMILNGTQLNEVSVQNNRMASLILPAELLPALLDLVG
jgi:hypothetical protein